jgi:hypothetical protein
MTPNDSKLSRSRWKVTWTNHQPSDYPVRPKLKGQRLLAPARDRVKTRS